MDDIDTYANEIQCLVGDQYLTISSNKIEDIEHFRFSKYPGRYIEKTENEIIDIVDKKFMKAVELEYEKDEEYGYLNLAYMSGGFDSRTRIWVAHESKSRHIQLKIYCNANYVDGLIAKKFQEIGMMNCL